MRNWLGVSALLVALFVGVGYTARLSSGTSYPSYSSLNTSPEGTSLLFDVLRLHGFRPTRNYTPSDHFRPRQTTVFRAAEAPARFLEPSEHTGDTTQGIAEAGNRLIVAFVGTQTAGTWKSKRLNITAKSKNNSYSLIPGPEWQHIEGASGYERSFGAGSIVILPDASALTNRNLAQDSQAPALVPALFKGHAPVIFDEAHLGVIESGSVGSLLRRYRLGGLLLGLLIAVALFIWKNAIRFPPAPHWESSSQSVVMGADRHTVLSGLLARHIQRNALMNTCLAEWNRLHPRHALKDISMTDPVAGYRIAAEQITNRKGTTTL